MFKWVGSKRRLVDDVIAHFPSKIERYVEPFMGGAHVGLSLLESGVKNVHFSDTNDDLISFWKAIKESPGALLKEIATYKSRIYKVDHAKIRRQRPETVVKKGARFYYLVKTSYRGLWRVNRSGEFNVSYTGCSKESFVPDSGEMYRVHDLLKHATIEKGDFRDVLKARHPVPTVFYLDPPYIGTFSSYAAEGFGNHEHTVLGYLFHKLKREGHVPVLSNIEHPFINDCYRDDNIYRVHVKHPTSCTAGAEDKVEVIVV